MTTLMEQAGQHAAADQAAEQHLLPHNVGHHERLYSAVGGGLLALLGLKKGGLSGLLLIGGGAALVHRAYTGHCPVYQKLGMDSTDRAAESHEYFERGVHVEEAFTINKPAAELFQYWRNFENLPQIMSHLESVKVLDDRKSHWVAKAPAGRTVEWDAEIINEEPNALIAWRSLDGADVHNAGSVRFVETGDRGTEVRVVIDYIPPAGQLGAWVAWLFGEEPSLQVRDDLRHFKQVMETGEIPTTQGQPRGTCPTGAYPPFSPTW